MKKNPFYENQVVLWNQRNTLRQIRDYHAELTDPNLQPMTLKLEGFSPYDDAVNVASYILRDLAAREAEYQLLTTNNALEKMKTAMRLVDAQIALNLQAAPSDMPAITAAVMADQQAVEERHAKLVQAFAKADQSGRLAAEQNEYLRGAYHDLIRDRESNVVGLVDPDLLDYEHWELVEYIGELRCDAVRHVLDANQDHMNKIATDLNHAAYLIKARDEGIIPESAYLSEEIQNRLDGAVPALEKCEHRFDLSRKYMASIFEMGPENEVLNPKDFSAVKYTVAPLQNIFA